MLWSMAWVWVSLQLNLVTQLLGSLVLRWLFVAARPSVPAGLADLGLCMKHMAAPVAVAFCNGRHHSVCLEDVKGGCVSWDNGWSAQHLTSQGLWIHRYASAGNILAFNGQRH